LGRENEGIAGWLLRLTTAQNASIERYNHTVRHEWLRYFMFNTVNEVQD